MSALRLGAEEAKRLTAEAMADPKPGDRFSEMLAFWVYVVKVEGGMVTTVEASAPCTFPQDGVWRTQTLTAFQKRFAYGGTTPGYWVRLVDRGNNVDGWEPTNWKSG